jgi:hypothetical protein
VEVLGLGDGVVLRSPLGGLELAEPDLSLGLRVFARSGPALGVLKGLFGFLGWFWDEVLIAFFVVEIAGLEK